MSPTLVYLLSSVGWSILGFAIGWFAASMRNDVTTIKETVVSDEDETPEVYEYHRPPPSLLLRFLGVVVLLLAVSTTALSLNATQRLNNVTSCQAEFNREFAEATQARALLAEQDRLALQDMLLMLYEQRNASQEERLETYEEWVSTVRSNEQERKESPLPELPRGECR